MKSTKFSIIVLIIILITSFTSGQNFWEQTSAPGYIITYAMFQDENEYIYASAQNIGIYRSTNNGTNWSLLTVGLTNLNISCIRGDFDGTLYLGTKWPGILFKSTNNAQTWSQVTTTPTDIVSVLAIKGTQNIFVGTAEGIYRSLDKGTSWQLLDNGIPTSFPTIIHNIVILHNGDILASVSTDTFSRVYRSTDNGDSWAPTTSDTYYITRIKVDECNNYIYMSFNGGELWRSVDDGYSWEVKNNGIITNITSDIAINSSNYVYLATQGQDFEEVYRTTDLGNNWEAISSGLPYVQVISLLLTKDGFIYAGTYRNNTGYGIYRSVTPTFTPPLVTTNDPVNVTQTTATLKGTLNPNGSNVDYFFEYGLTTSYGNVTPTQSGGSGNTNLIVLSNISGLQQNTPYHNRLIAEMCDGARIYGNDLQFTTLPLSSIELTSPNGGENWQVGSQEDITWSTIGIENVKIEYSIDDGIYWNPVINSTSANSGTYSWMIPNTPSTQCKVRISDVLNSSIADTSSNTFTISEAPIITVTTPSTGTIWEALSQQTVTWTSVNVLGNVNIKLDTDGSLTFPITLKSNTTNDSTELITVPDNPSSTCRIRVESFGNPTNIFGLNNGNFTITPPVDVHDILNNQPTEYSLHQNFPNPFNPVTRIYYAVPTESPVTIRLYDILGKEIKLLVDEIKTTGNYWIDLDASELHSGVYIYQMRSVKFNQSKKLILMK